MLALAAAAALILGHAAPTCTSSQLAVSAGRSSGAAGTIAAELVVRNRSRAACTLRGYPKPTILGPRGPLPTSVVRGGLPLLARPLRTVALAPGGRAYVLYAWNDVPVGAERSCPRGVALLVVLPGTARGLRVAAPTRACGGGRLLVSPVFAPRPAPF